MPIEYKWLNFLGYRKYRVGSDGSVWSYRRRKFIRGIGRIWKWKRLKRGYGGSKNYPTVRLYKNGIGKVFLVHRLVLLAYRGKCPKGKEGRHYPDPSPDNCNLENLHWASKSRNQRDRIIHGTHNQGFKHGKSVLCPAALRYILRNKNKYTCRHMSRVLGVSKNTVNRAANHITYRYR